MPIDSQVHRMYQHLLSSGYDIKSAARIAQAKTGLSLHTGLPAKQKPQVKAKKK